MSPSLNPSSPAFSGSKSYTAFTNQSLFTFNQSCLHLFTVHNVQNHTPPVKITVYLQFDESCLHLFVLLNVQNHTQPLKIRVVNI